jgi:predicted metal-dependent phosphoesterase TrpH
VKNVLRLDLHVHSRYSPDATLPLEAAAHRLGIAGLHGFALTDHNTVRGHVELRGLRERYPHAWLLPGVEVSAREGHLLIYGVSEAPPRGRPAAETIDWANDRAGVVVLAHPFRWIHGVGGRLAAQLPAAALEVRNGRTAESANTRAELVAAQRSLGTTGGSDAHEVATIGRAYTELHDEPASLEDLLEALRRHRTSIGGRSLAAPGRLWLAARNGLRRAARGFRAV